MKVFTFLLSATLTVFLASFVWNTADDTPSAATQPNIIYILADDLGYGDLGKFYQDARTDDKKFDTPYLDQMADEGMMLMNHYTSAPVCAPSRSSLLQGLHQGHAAARDDQFDKELPDDISIQNILKESGYGTYHVGKYGLAGLSGSNLNGHPLSTGFDEFFGYLFHLEGHNHYPQGDANNTYLHDGFNTITSGTDNVYTTDVWTAKAKKMITNHVAQSSDDPFFLYLAYDCPHAQLQTPTQAYPSGMGLNGGLQWTGASSATPYVNTASGTPNSWLHPDYANKSWNIVEKQFATMVRRIDTSVGDIMKLLEDLNIDDNTIIVFSSDNGPHFEGGQDPRSFRSFADLDGIKRDLWEAGIRVPTIARMPGTIPSGSATVAPSGHWDWMATFADLAEVPKPALSDGTSLVPVLSGTSNTLDRETLYFEYRYGGAQKTPNYAEFEPSHRAKIRAQMQAVMIDDYKGVRYNIQSHSDDFRIYDIANDPKETTDLAASNPALQRQMKNKVLQMRLKNPTAPRPYDDELIPDVSVTTSQGLSYKYFEDTYNWIPDFEDMQGTSKGTTTDIDLSVRERNFDFGLYFEGYIMVPVDGEYTFYTQSQAPVHLMIHDIHVINNDWNFTVGELSQSLHLKAGLHPIKLFYWHEYQSVHQFDLKYEGPGIAKTSVPANAFFRDDSFLPVEYTCFSATRTNDDVLVKWCTQTEINNDYFEVQHSSNAQNFKTIATIYSTSTSNEPKTYYHLDTAPEQGVNYYRIKQVDTDGSTVYTNVVAVKFAYEFDHAYPNPTVGMLYVSSDTSGQRLEIRDLFGRLVYEGTTLEETTNVDIQHLPSGMYVLQIGEETTLKIMKQ